MVVVLRRPHEAAFVSRLWACGRAWIASRSFWRFLATARPCHDVHATAAFCLQSHDLHAWRRKETEDEDPNAAQALYKFPPVAPDDNACSLLGQGAAHFSNAVRA
jgi:hypothetical protein